MTDRAEGTRRLYRLHDEGIEAVQAYLAAGLGRRRRALQAAGRQLMEPLELEFTVACDAARAFSLWAEQTTRWWPHGHSVSAEPGLDGHLRAAARRAHLRAHADRRRARLGRGARVGAAAPARLSLAPALRPRRRDRGRGHLHAGRRRHARSGSSTAAGSGSAPSPRSARPQPPRLGWHDPSVQFGPAPAARARTSTMSRLTAEEVMGEDRDGLMVRVGDRELVLVAGERHGPAGAPESGGCSCLRSSGQPRRDLHDPLRFTLRPGAAGNSAAGLRVRGSCAALREAAPSKRTPAACARPGWRGRAARARAGAPPRLLPPPGACSSTRA